MKGERKLFETHVSGSSKTPQKPLSLGRSKELNAARNLKMIYRYFYYAKILNKSYPYSIAQLALEFTLSEIRIIKILSENHLALKEVIQAKKPGLHDLKTMYPYLVWEAP